MPLPKFGGLSPKATGGMYYRTSRKCAKRNKQSGELKGNGGRTNLSKRWNAGATRTGEADDPANVY